MCRYTQPHFDIDVSSPVRGEDEAPSTGVTGTLSSKGRETTASPSKKSGLEALLTPEESVVVLIDHQPFQFANLHSHEPTMVVNNVVGLAKAAKGFKVPTILTTVTEERGGYIIKSIQDVFPDQKPINRTTLNAWEDKRVVDAVKKTGRRQVIFAALWTEICLAYPVIHSGYELTDRMLSRRASVAAGDSSAQSVSVKGSPESGP